MPRINQGGRVPQTPTFEQPPAVKAETKKAFKAAFEKAQKSGQLDFHAGGLPLGQRFVRVPLKEGFGADQYSFTALVPAGALAPNAKASDPNKAKSFFVERSGGFAGITTVAGPITMGAKGAVTVEPFFNRYLEGQDGAAQPAAPKAGWGPGRATEPTAGEPTAGDPTFGTEKFPSDNEDGGARPANPGRPGNIGTEKFPSDNEDGGAAPGTSAPRSSRRTTKTAAQGPRTPAAPGTSAPKSSLRTTKTAAQGPRTPAAPGTSAPRSSLPTTIGSRW